MPNPTASSIIKKPHETPIEWGNVFLKPKLIPDASSIILLGPGVIDVANENMDKAKNVSIFMMLLSYKVGAFSSLNHDNRIGYPRLSQRIVGLNGKNGFIFECLFISMFQGW